MIHVALNGYGRIGRNTLRALYERNDLNDRIRSVAINDLGDTAINAHLTQYDTRVLVQDVQSTFLPFK